MFLVVQPITTLLLLSTVAGQGTSQAVFLTAFFSCLPFLFGVNEEDLDFDEISRTFCAYSHACLYPIMPTAEVLAKFSSL